MDAPPQGHQIYEEESYRQSFAALGDARLIDEALEGVLWTLWLNPHVWEVVPGFTEIRIALTDRIVRDDGTVVPRLRVWFKIGSGDTKSVQLLFIEVDDGEPLV